MLTCIEFDKGEGRGDYNDQELEEDIEFGALRTLNSNRWFHDNCDLCGKKIYNKRSALRMALANGGWRGCYCSNTCVITDIPDWDDDTDTNARLLKELNTRFHNMLLKFGLAKSYLRREIEEDIEDREYYHDEIDEQNLDEKIAEIKNTRNEKEYKKYTFGVEDYSFSE
jgi:predicted DNA-binding protein